VGCYALEILRSEACGCAAGCSVKAFRLAGHGRNRLAHSGALRANARVCPGLCMVCVRHDLGAVVPFGDQLVLSPHRGVTPARR